MIDFINNGTEFLVEKVFKKNAGVVVKCIGKAFVSKTLHLNNSQLELIWDLANFEASQPNSDIVPEGTYAGMKFFYRDGVVYIPMSDVGIVNDDVLISRKKSAFCYYLNSSHRSSKSEWSYSDRGYILHYYSNHPFINTAY